MVPKIQSLVTNRRLLAWLCLYPAPGATSSLKRSAYIVLSAVVCFSTICALASSTAYFIKFMSTDLEESLCALFQVSCFSNVTYVIIVAYFLKSKIVAILNDLDSIYDACKIFENILSPSIFIRYKFGNCI